MAASFPTGTRVILHGLTTRHDYNGRVGVLVQALDVATGRCVVKLSDGEECSLRHENLTEEGCDGAQFPSARDRDIGSRVMLHGLTAQPHYNSRVGIVTQAAQRDGHCTVTLCHSGEEVAVRSQNLKDAGEERERERVFVSSGKERTSHARSVDESCGISCQVQAFGA